MAAPSKTTKPPAAKRKPPAAAERKPPVSRAAKPAPKPADARDALSLVDLARGIVAKEIRSRVQDVRRLAEAVLAGVAKPKKAKKDKADGGKKKDKSKKKLAKIPGQQAKK